MKVSNRNKAIQQKLRKTNFNSNASDTSKY